MHTDMGALPSRRQGADPPPPLVAFDFDGTLTCRDSFRAFLAWRAGPWRYGLGLARLAPAALAWLVHRDRSRLKSAMVREFLAGARPERVGREAESFAAALADRLIRPDALACWRAWRERGAELVIVTASPELIVAPLARRLGADGLLGSHLALDPEGRLTGQLDGPNCRGAEKVARLREAYGAGRVLAAGYGDSDGDREMLALAVTAGLKVFRERP